MRACLLNATTRDMPKLYDHRYFYIEDSIGHCTCGLAQETMARVLRDIGEDIFLDSEWLNSMITFRNNPSVLGFIVEQACLSSISQKGLKVGGLGFDNIPTIMFQKEPTYKTSEQIAIYVPIAFNFKAIDGLILSLDTSPSEGIKGKARLIPIQITIASSHSDSATTFFNKWKNWIKGLEEYDVEATFLWITEGTRATIEVEKNEMELRKVQKSRPSYTLVNVTIEDVNKDIGRKLKIARKES